MKPKDVKVGDDLEMRGGYGRGSLKGPVKVVRIERRVSQTGFLFTVVDSKGSKLELDAAWFKGIE